MLARKNRGQANYFSIKKAFRRELGSAKTGAERTVDLPNVLVQELRRLKTRRKRQALKAGIRMPQVVFHRKGEHMAQNQARRVFNRVLTEAKLPKHRLHNTRHSYASIMLKNGASLDYIKRMLGHTNIAMTRDVYAHLMPNRDRSQVNTLGEMLIDSAPWN